MIKAPIKSLTIDQRSELNFGSNTNSDRHENGLIFTAVLCGDNAYNDGSTLKRLSWKRCGPSGAFSTNSQSFWPSSDITKRMKALATAGLGAHFKIPIPSGVMIVRLSGITKPILSAPASLTWAQA